MRAVALPEVPNPTWAVILDMPLSTTIEQRIQQETGIRVGEVSAILVGGVQPVIGRPIEDRPVDEDDGPQLSLRQARWVVFLDHVDWATGKPESVSAGIVINTFEVFDRISVVSPVGLGQMNFGQLLLFVLALVGGLFLIIQFVALVDRLRAGAAGHRRRPRSVYRHAARARRRFRAPDSGARARSAW